MDDEEPCYALKCIDINEQPNLSPDGKQRAVREAQALLKLQHPNVARYHKAFLSEGRLCYMTEFAEQTLHHLIYTMKERQQRLSEDLTWHLFIQICHGLKKLHDSAIIHRALKVRAPPRRPAKPRCAPPHAAAAALAQRKPRASPRPCGTPGAQPAPPHREPLRRPRLQIPMQADRPGHPRAAARRVRTRCPVGGQRPTRPPGVGHRGLRPPQR